MSKKILVNDVETQIFYNLETEKYEADLTVLADGKNKSIVLVEK